MFHQRYLFESEKFADEYIYDVKVSYYRLMGPDETGSALPIDDYIQVDFKVTLKDGEFVLSDTEITATADFDSYN